MKTLRKINQYHCWIFDCDGVLLNSNRIKTEALSEIALPYGKSVHDTFIKYHMQNGGLSRHRKFEYLFKEILGVAKYSEPMNNAMNTFASRINQKLLDCPEIPGARDFLDSLQSSCNKFVVSGGLEVEVREILENRGLAGYFKEILGSPGTKIEHLQRLKNLGLLQYPSVFVGDGKLDFEAANQFGMDFIFLYGATEFKEWKKYFLGRKVASFDNFNSLKREISNRD